MIIDSQSVKTAEGGRHRGFDAGKKASGRKRFAAVDVEGNLVDVVVTGADVSDNTGGIALLEKIAEQFPSVRAIWCDQGFKKAFVEHARQLGLQVVVISRRPGSTGFTVLPRRSWTSSTAATRTCSCSATPARAGPRRCARC
ncbi:transposase [Kineococcus arenarius]|uniref:transposase n=1 Tax=unclassified Kineococcus TaxID=2621656 RepID=UPI003D7F1852